MKNIREHLDRFVVLGGLAVVVCLIAGIGFAVLAARQSSWPKTRASVAKKVQSMRVERHALFPAEYSTYFTIFIDGKMYTRRLRFDPQSQSDGELVVRYNPADHSDFCSDLDRAANVNASLLAFGLMVAMGGSAAYLHWYTRSVKESNRRHLAPRVTR